MCFFLLCFKIKAHCLKKKNGGLSCFSFCFSTENLFPAAWGASLHISKTRSSWCNNSSEDAPGKRSWIGKWRENTRKNPSIESNIFCWAFEIQQDWKGEWKVSITKRWSCHLWAPQKLMSVHIDNKRQKSGCKLHFKVHYCCSDMNTVAL